MGKRKLILILVLIVLLLALTAPALAQDVVVTVPAVPEGNPATSMGQAAQNIFAAIYSATYLPFAAGLVTILVGLCKRIPVKVSGPTWTFGWTVIVWVAFVAANHFGFGNQFSTFVQAMTTIGAMVLGVAVTPMAAGKLYSQAVSRKVAVVGYQRTA